MEQSYCLTEEDIDDIFVFWVEAIYSNEFPVMQNIPAEDQVEGLTKYFLECASKILK